MAATGNANQSIRVDFDADALRQRYEEERDKRIRQDGNDQYVVVGRQFGHLLEDPYADPDFSREPLHHEVEVLVIGGGIGGLLASVRLQQAGVDDIWIVEQAGDFGGTWYWNRYPGAQCDVESYIYLPLLEELGYTPKEKYGRAEEILAYCRTIGERFDLYRRACFQTKVTETRWDEAASRWTVHTSRGDAIRARYVVMCNGFLSRPKLPGIPGLESFAGHSFHTSRWDYDYTGGSPDGNLEGLADKRVAIVGTGATAVQCVPQLAESAAHLYVFQRTPSSIDVRRNGPTDLDWFKSLKPGWQQRRMQNFNRLVAGGDLSQAAPEEMTDDGWTDIFRTVPILTSDGDSEPLLGERVELADYHKMEQLRRRVDDQVADAKVAEALKPWYRYFCKRPCFHEAYLAAFNKPNVTLVDTEGQGVQQITPTGLVAAGKEYEVDCLVFATGFDVSADFARRTGFEISGRGGLTLTEKWAEGMRTLHGFQSRGFPNCFFMGVTQGTFTANYPHMLNEQSIHIAYLIGHARNNNFHHLEPSLAAEDGWVDTIKQMAHFNMTFQSQCTPGFYNNEGQINSRNSLLANTYGAGPEAFFDLLEEWRAEGSLEGIEFS